MAAQLAILAAWAVGALLVQIAAHALRGHPPVPPTTGSPLERAVEGGLAGATATPPAALEDRPDTLSPTETALVRDWLARLGTP